MDLTDYTKWEMQHKLRIFNSWT